MDNKIKICSVCGVTSQENKVGFIKGLCNKHYRQLLEKGRITDSLKPATRSIYEPNDYIYVEDYVEICIYDKYGVETVRAIIDVEDVELVKMYKWRLDGKGYVSTVKNKKYQSLHRLILNPPKNKVVDHINRNVLDNRRENLRICSQSENIRNKSVNCNNSSGCTGVIWNKEKSKWNSYISINHKNIHLGYYTNKEDAIEARKKAEEKYFGEFIPR
jgi:hypothetical protein